MEIIDISTLLIKSHNWLAGWMIEYLIDQIISWLNSFWLIWLKSLLVCVLDGWKVFWFVGYINDWLVDWFVRLLVIRFVDSLILIYRWICWFTVSLIDWLIGWLIDIGKKRWDERIERTPRWYGGREGRGFQEPEILRGGETACNDGDTKTEKGSGEY